MAKQSLHIKELRNAFTHVQYISFQDIIKFYKQFDDEIKRSTVDWRIYELKKEVILYGIARGIYSLSETNIYIPEVSRSLKLLFSVSKKKFPFVEMCIWNTKLINEFMLHQPGRFYTILEIEKDVKESVFYALKELGKDVYLDPTIEMLNKYVINKNDPIIITSLVTEAPTQKVNGVNTITLEKLLVDLFCNETLFAAHGGAELEHIYSSALDKYTTSNTKLLRYASRRNKKEAIELLIDKKQRNGNKY